VRTGKGRYSRYLQKEKKNKHKFWETYIRSRSAGGDIVILDSLSYPPISDGESGTKKNSALCAQKRQEETSERTAGGMATLNHDHTGNHYAAAGGEKRVF